MHRQVFKDRVKRILVSGLPDGASRETVLKVRFLNGFLLFSIFMSCYLLLAELAYGSQRYIALDVVGIITFLTIFAALRHTRNVRMLTDMTLFFCLTILLVNHFQELYLHEANGSALGTLSIFPPIAFFLAGTKRGLRWVIAMAVFEIWMYVLGHLKMFSISVGAPLFISLVNYGLISFFIYFYRTTIDGNKRVLEGKNSKLQDAFSELETSHKELKQKIAVIEELNDHMIHRELRMIELKDELSKLKTEA